MADASELTSKTCKPCAGAAAALTESQAQVLAKELTFFKIAPDGKRLEARFTLKNFMACVKKIIAIAEIAETENHHPDLLLEGYKNLTVRLSTHDVGGLSENDFIVAAKIEALATK